MKAPAGYRFDRLSDNSLYRWRVHVNIPGGIDEHTGTATTLDAALAAAWAHHRKQTTPPPAWLPVPVEEGSAP